jgi:hypothetical protein
MIRGGSTPARNRLPEPTIASMRFEGPIKALELGRAAAVTFGGQVVLVAGLATAAAVGLRDLAACRRPRARAVAALGAAAVYFGVAEPWMRRWGTTAERAPHGTPR